MPTRSVADREADELWTGLAVDPPERLRCLTTAMEEPGSGRPQEEPVVDRRVGSTWVREMPHTDTSGLIR